MTARMLGLCGMAAWALAAGARQEFTARPFPPEVKTIGVVMPASILAKARFDKGVAMLEKAGYRVKTAKRLSFAKVAPVADRVADFEETWLDPEVDLVLCARGGTGAQDVITKVDWEKLKARPNQRVLGFSNITMILNAMLKKGVGHPISGSTISHFLYAQGDTCDWLNRAVAGAPQPEAKLTPLRPGAFEGLPCGGHIALVALGVKMDWTVGASNRVVFLERNPSTDLKGLKGELDYLAASGWLKGAAGVVFGDVRAKQTGGGGTDPKAVPASRADVEALRREFAQKMTCPVYEGYAYGHIPVSHAIDFRRVVSVAADGTMRWK